MDYIREQFKLAFNRLVVRVGVLDRNSPIEGKRFQKLQRESILSSILFVDHEIQRRRNKHVEDYNRNLSKLITPFGNLTYPDFDYIMREYRLEIINADRARIEKTARTKYRFNRIRVHDF